MSSNWDILSSSVLSFRIWTSSPSPEDSSGLGFGAPSSPFDRRSFWVDLGIDLGVGVIVEVESGAQWARDSGQQWKRRRANQESGERTVSPRIWGLGRFPDLIRFSFREHLKHLLSADDLERDKYYSELEALSKKIRSLPPSNSEHVSRIFDNRENHLTFP